MRTIRVLLTFDDGPDAGEEGRPSPTLRIAEVLKRKELNGFADDIKAAFFVQTGISYRGGNSQGLTILRELADQGHLLGIHTGSVGDFSVDHLDHVERQRQGKLAEDMDLAVLRLSEAGVRAKYVRPTFAHFDDAVLKTYQSRGLQVILWDVDSRDAAPAKAQLGPAGLRPRPVRAVISSLRNGAGSVERALSAGVRDLVVLFHDINPTTAANLPAYLKAIHETALDLGDMKWRVEFITETADIDDMFSRRHDEGAVARLPASVETDDSPVTAAHSNGYWMLAGGALAGFVLGALAVWAVRRRRPLPPVSPDLPVAVLEALVQEAPLTGSQAACIADRLQKLRLDDLDRIELAAHLVTVRGNDDWPDPACGRAAEMAERAGLVERNGGGGQLTSLGATQLGELERDRTELAWARFVHARLHEGLVVACPRCRTAQQGHWFRTILACTTCKQRFCLRDSPSVTPCPAHMMKPAVAASTAPPDVPIMVRRVPRRRWLNTPARVRIALAATVLLAIGGVILLRPPVAKNPVLHQIVVDQFGYQPAAEKIVVFVCPQQVADLPPFDPGTEFQVRRQSDDQIVLSGLIQVWNGGATDSVSGDRAWHGDFSALTTPGRYYISLPGGTNRGGRSYDFAVQDDVYDPVLLASGRTFFYQRCGVDLPEANGGNWFHAACHCQTRQDMSARRWDGAKGSPAGQPRNVHGGWHDAGDYGKYVEYLFDPLWDLLHAVEWYPAVFSDRTNIPESGNGVPDMLDEVKHELDWLLRMQLADGSVLGKVGVIEYPLDETSPPNVSTAPRYYTDPSTGATATAAWALGARLYRRYARQYPGYAARLQEAAEKGWRFLAAHPAPIQYPDGGMGTPIHDSAGTVLLEGGGSSNSTVAAPQERQLRLAAAAELFTLTGINVYRAYFDAQYDSADMTEEGHQPIRDNAFAVGLSTVSQRALISYALAPGASPAVVARIKIALKNGIDRHVLAKADTDPYRAYLDPKLYNWGSNLYKANAALLPLWGLKLGVDADRSRAYQDRVEGYLHYFHGCNPLNLVYLTNMGPRGANAGAKKSVMRPHHAWFQSTSPFYDGPESKYGPAPGFLVGGPNGFYKGVAEPPRREPPMKAYVDGNWRGEGSNNWWEVNEPQVRMQAAYTLLLAATCAARPEAGR